MATGDTLDFARRLRAVLPDRWFPSDAASSPVLEMVLEALGATAADLYAQVQYAGLQGRLKTATGGFLDFAAADYDGTTLVRRPGESDSAFRARLLPILRDKGTRAALIARLQALTGNTPWVFEPSNASDTGGYGVALGYGTAASAPAGPTIQTEAGATLTMEDGTTAITMQSNTNVPNATTGGGGYGSYSMPCQMFIRIARAPGAGIANADGYNGGLGGYGVGRIMYAAAADALPHVTDADIFATITDVMPAGTIGWTAIG